MGLDAVEMVMAVEEVFGIVITDEEAQDTKTPGQLVDLVMKKVDASDKPTCFSQSAFHLLRRQAVTTLGVPRRDFRLKTPLQHIVPRSGRRRLWEKFAQSVGAGRWPELERPGSLVWFSTGVTVIIWIIAVVSIGQMSDSRILAHIFGLMTTAFAGWTLIVATRPLKVHFPTGYSNVEGLVQFMVSRNPELLGESPKQWSRERVWGVVRDIIIEQTGAADFDEDSSFVNDILTD